MADKRTSGKSPAFQFYPDDWLADENVRLLSLAETGAYIDAIALCWREGSIPADPEKLARLIGKGCSIDIATNVQRLFNVRLTSVAQPLNKRTNENCDVVDRLQHKRLNEERTKQQERREQQSNAGRKSAATRRLTPTKSTEVVANQEVVSDSIDSTSVQRVFNERSTCVQHPCNSSSSTSSSTSSIINTPLPPKRGNAKNKNESAISGVPGYILEDVKAIYNAYPRHIAPNAAYRAIAKALGFIAASELLAIVERYAERRRRPGNNPTLTPHPATWFNAGRWKDDPHEWDRLDEDGRKNMLPSEQQFFSGISEFLIESEQQQ